MQALDRHLDADRVPVAGCGKGVMAPLTEVQASRAYRARSNRIFDCASLRRDAWNTRRLDLFLADLVAQADSPEGSSVCAAGMIEAWARAGAMTAIGGGGYETQSRAAIMWTLGGVSAAYLVNPEIQMSARESGAEATILGWFRGLAEGVKADIFRKREADDQDNIQYWQGFAILPTALMTGDAELLGLSRSTFDAAMHEVTRNSLDPARDGFLPLELERGNKSLHYQAYALHPIVGMAVASQAYGCDFLDSPWKRRQFVNLVVRTMEGVNDPGLFSAEIALRTPGRTPIVQQRSYTARHSPELLYLVNRLDPELFERIDADVADTLDRTPPAVQPDSGRDASRRRMGGRLLKLADAAESLADVRLPSLAGTCGNDR